MADDSVNLFAKLDVSRGASRDLRTTFWVAHYPTPRDIEAKTYGWVMCIDPNGVRARGPRGPIYFLLDAATVIPGLTDRTGTFIAYLNDNARHFPPGHRDEGELIHWDMYLLREGETYILDADEFWIGLQRGGEIKHIPSSVFSHPSELPYPYRDLSAEFRVRHPYTPLEGDRGLHCVFTIPVADFLGTYEEFAELCLSMGKTQYFVDHWWSRFTDVLTTDNPEDNTWYSTGGVDGKGSGRRWIMGGYISQRYYEYGENTLITAVIHGKDYMDLWKDQPFGTPTVPRNYTTTSDFAGIAEHIMDDVNLTSGVSESRTETDYTFTSIHDVEVDLPHINIREDSEVVETTDKVTQFVKDVDYEMDYREGTVKVLSTGSMLDGTDYYITYNYDFGTPFTKSTSWWPGEGAVPATTGVEWIKEFKQEWAMDVMKDGCEEAGWEWQINHRKEVLLYPRTAGPIAVQPLIQYSRNIRSIPQIMMGDTSELITNIVVTDGEAVTVPPEVDAWSRNSSNWPDLTNPNSSWDIVDFPAPPNVKRNMYADPSLTFDDEGHAALCFIKDTHLFFDLVLSFHKDSGGHDKFAELSLDMRKWRRLKFRFRHATRDEDYEYGGAHYTVGTRYRVMIKDDMGNGYYYDFGKGTANPVNRSPQLVNGNSDDDTVDNTEFNDIDLLLPEADIDGAVSSGNLKGWVRIGGYTGSTINYVEIYVKPAEPDPGPYGPSVQLASNIAAGDDYINLVNPERLAGFLGSGTVRSEFTHPVEVIMKKGTKEETMFITGINGQFYPTGKNTRLITKAQSSFTTPATAYVRVGFTVAFSQLRFERGIRYDDEALSPLGPPYRYKLISSKEMEYLNESQSKAATALAQEGSAKQWVRVHVDGDPLFNIGYRVVIQLDPGHSKVFQGTRMMIDDIEYVLNENQFTQVLLLSPVLSTVKARLLNEATAFDTLFRKTDNLGTPTAKRGSSSTVR